MEIENAILISLNKERKNKAFMTHWDKKYTRPETKYAIIDELIKDTLLTEKEIVAGLNSLEAQNKVGTKIAGSKQNLFYWWFLK
jgi:hypothetical protein